MPTILASSATKSPPPSTIFGGSATASSDADSAPDQCPPLRAPLGPLEHERALNAVACSSSSDGVGGWTEVVAALGRLAVIPSRRTPGSFPRGDRDPRPERRPPRAWCAVVDGRPADDEEPVVGYRLVHLAPTADLGPGSGEVSVQAPELSPAIAFVDPRLAVLSGWVVWTAHL